MLKASSVALGVLSVLALTAAVYFMRNFDVYLAVLCALAADIYIFWLSSRNPSRYEPAERNPRRSFPTLLLVVGLIPLSLALSLGVMGFLGSPIMAALNVIVVVGFSITFFFISFSIPLGLKYAYMERKRTSDESYNPLVSILVPAYNEEKVLSRTLETLTNLKYGNKEIIVVDDGSTDKTNVIASWYKQFGVKVVRKPNGGKARALNYGLLFARGEIVVTVDADGMLPRDAVDEIVKIMSNRKVNAVSGNVKALNCNNVLTHCQELEYVTAVNTLRNALDLFGAVIVVPGAFGAFRKEAIVNTGYYDPDTLTEDFDLTVKIQKAYGSIAASTTAIAYTEVPATWRGLYRQRMRWIEGTYQTVAKHKDAFWNTRYGYLQNLIFPLLILSFMVPFATFAAWTAAVLLALNGGLYTLLIMLALFFLIQFFVVMMALSLDNNRYSLGIYSTLLVVGYRQVLDFISILALFHFLVSGRSRRGKVEWKRVERVGGIKPVIKV
ncbi:MAG TPA: glycosyltransferase [Nitrososphaerales archaeon]|nr:glycosyltransferase [Nitrososphaerales archaeon]